MKVPTNHMSILVDSIGTLVRANVIFSPDTSLDIKELRRQCARRLVERQGLLPLIEQLVENRAVATNFVTSHTTQHFRYHMRSHYERDGKFNMTGAKFAKELSCTAGFDEAVRSDSIDKVIEAMPFSVEINCDIAYEDFLEPCLVDEHSYTVLCYYANILDTVRAVRMLSNTKTPLEYKFVAARFGWLAPMLDALEVPNNSSYLLGRKQLQKKLATTRVSALDLMGVTHSELEFLNRLRNLCQSGVTALLLDKQLADKLERTWLPI